VAWRVGADVIVIGTHAVTGWRRSFPGSFAERGLAVVPCPLLSRPRPAPVMFLPSGEQRVLRRTMWSGND
jgi:hypothetical protein